MTHFERLILTLAIIFISLAAGYFFRRMVEWGKIAITSQGLDILRNRLQTWAVFVLIPLAAMLSLWGLPQPHPQLLGLPLLGLVSYICGGALALGGAYVLGFSRTQIGSFFCCGTFTNIGAVGSLVCLLYLGENSIAMVALYRLLEEIYYFGVAFPVARRFGTPSVRSLLSPGPLLAMIVSALILGVLLNISGVPRPDICGTVASASVLVSTVFFLFAIGLTLRLSRLGSSLASGLVMCAIKFIGIPAIVIPIGWLVGYGTLESGLPLKTVAILCSMPVAMTALVPPSLFRLDVDLANACWLITTAGLVLVLPWLMWLLPHL